MTDIDYEPLALGDRIAYTCYRGKLHVTYIIGFTAGFVEVGDSHQGRVAQDRIVKIFDQGGQK
jgi:hypothetical protein